MRILSAEMLRDCGVLENDGILVGLSGGADSVALLLSLVELRDEGAVSGLNAAHLDHGIRAAAAEDAAFCEALCRRVSVPFTAERVDVPARAEASHETLEEAARRLRYGFLRRARATCGASCIAVAHNREDQAETLLLHLLRGCGLTGLAGMRPRNGDVVRPLLNVSRREIEAYLTERGEPWRTDETNASTAYTRNRIRLELLPLLDTFRPDAATALAKTASLVAADEAYLAALAEQAFEKIASGGGVDRKAFCALPEPLRARIAKTLLLAHTPDVTEADIRRVNALSSAETGTRIELAGGRSAWVDHVRLYVGDYPAARTFEVDFLFEGTTAFPGGTLESGLVPSFEKPRNGFEAYLDFDRLPEGLTVRTRRAGDRFHPFGGPGSRKLSDYLTDRKEPLTARDMPLLAKDGEIYWVSGYAVSEKVRVTPETKNILHIVYRGGNER